jgi:hypothetical protein
MTERIISNLGPHLSLACNIVPSTFPGIDSATANSKLQLLGWNGAALDYQALQLAVAYMEVQTGSVKMPPTS